MFLNLVVNIGCILLISAQTNQPEVHVNVLPWPARKKKLKPKFYLLNTMGDVALTNNSRETAISLDDFNQYPKLMKELIKK